MGGRLRHTALVFPAALAGLTLLLSACGGPGSDVTTLSGPPTTDSSLTLTLQHSPVGPILPRGRQHALRLRPRHSDPQRLHQHGLHLPMAAAGHQRPSPRGQGDHRALVGTLHRPDGSTQLSYGGHPLYTYNGDVAPGVVMGQAINQDGGLWYVLNAQGSRSRRGSPSPRRPPTATPLVEQPGPRWRTC